MRRGRQLDAALPSQLKRNVWYDMAVKLQNDHMERGQDHESCKGGGREAGFGRDGSRSGRTWREVKS